MPQSGWLRFLVGCSLFILACSTASRVIPIPSPSADAPRSPNSVDTNYTEILAAISEAMKQELNFTPPRGVVTFYSDHQAFENGLAEAFEGDTRRIENLTGKRQPKETRQQNIELAARQRALTAAAVAVNDKVLVNTVAFDGYTSSERVHVLAHELTHVLQRDLSEGRPTSWESWIIEGFADWVGYQVLDRLNIEPFVKTRERVLESVIAGATQGTVPSLTQLHTQADVMTWTRSQGRYAAYGQGMIAVDLLIQEKGMDAVINYFRLFAKRNDRQANFAAAFGASLAEFDERFGNHLKILMTR